MNKKDLMLIGIILFISLIFLLLFNKNNSYAYIYYENELVKEIDLSVNNNYEVKGYNGKVKIEVKNNKLRVVKEDSPLHICSKQGFSNSTPIVCLPNKIVIEFSNDLDTIIS